MLFFKLINYKKLLKFGYFTSNVTDRRRGPKRKLQAGYRALSRHHYAMCHQSYVSIGRRWL